MNHSKLQTFVLFDNSEKYPMLYAVVVISLILIGGVRCIMFLFSRKKSFIFIAWYFHPKIHTRSGEASSTIKSFYISCDLQFRNNIWNHINFVIILVHRICNLCMRSLFSSKNCSFWFVQSTGKFCVIRLHSLMQTQTCSNQEKKPGTSLSFIN